MMAKGMKATMSRQMVADHVARAQQQVANAAEHAAVAHAPDVEIQQQRILKRIAAYLARLTAAGTVVALKVGAAGGTIVLLL